MRLVIDHPEDEPPHHPVGETPTPLLNRGGDIWCGRCGSAVMKKSTKLSQESLVPVVKF